MIWWCINLFNGRISRKSIEKCAAYTHKNTLPQNVTNKLQTCRGQVAGFTFYLASCK